MTGDIFKSTGFHEATEAWFCKSFEKPSAPQIKGWPKIAAGCHTLILSPTGSGKTLAAFLWSIDELLRLGLTADAKEFERNRKGIHTLYISPLKALNNDIYRNLKQPLRGIAGVLRERGLEAPIIRAAVRTGDTPSSERQSMLRRPPHILNTTPESLYLLLTSERVRPLFRSLKYVIVDEIHSISSNKRGVHLSLSLERLSALCETEPTRIGLSATQRPLQRIADFLGGQTPGKTYQPRSIQIVDCGRIRDLNIRMESPVRDFSQLPDATVWPAVIERLYKIIREHRTSLVFVNMRAQSEKIARQLNERLRQETGDPEAVLALAHHGSISREMRYHIENELKRGTIPAVIATTSLELGIDIGSIDLVVQLNAPASVTSLLQRIGRSGHSLNAVSCGLVMPLYKADLDDAAALIRAALNADIEETRIPENALDVLAQQIVAELSMRSMQRVDLYQLVRGSYCYRRLSESLFNSVVEMLAGRFSSAELQALNPRISWDRINDRLIARRGARLTAVMNGGTIADRGYYGVYLQGTRTRLGEVEEEFVFESRVGDIFFLGNNEWRIADIERDRIFVTPRASSKPRAPFWKAEPQFRDLHTSLKIGAFRRELEPLLEKSGWLDDCPATEDTRHNTLDLMRRQKAHTGMLPTDQCIVAEFFTDSVNEHHLVIHAPFGGRVLGAWAAALGRMLEQRFNTQVQFTFDDDAILIRLPDVQDFSILDDVLYMDYSNIERLLLAALPNTPLFAVRFRHNATRALLLQRSRIGKRIPLWLQRLRSADLLQSVSRYPDFPIMLETVRDCLHDIFDSDGLKSVFHKIKRGEIGIHKIRTTSPSPLASGVMFRLVFNHMYDYDQSRAPGQAAEFHLELLDDILSRDTIPTLVPRETVQQAERVWQYNTPESRARDAEDLYEIISAMGPVQEEELSHRSESGFQQWLQELLKSGRIERQGEEWITKETIKLIEQDSSGVYRLQRMLKLHGPVSVRQLCQGLNVQQDQVYEQLLRLFDAKKVVRGKLITGSDEEQWCDREHFAQLYRQAIAVRRKAHEPLIRSEFYRFLFDWHRISRPARLSDTLQQYNGYALPPFDFERMILPERIHTSEKCEKTEHALNSLVSSGEVLPICPIVSSAQPVRVCYLLRSSGSLFFDRGQIQEMTAAISNSAQTVFSFLKENAASPHQDICAGTGMTPLQVDDALVELSRSGLVTCDDQFSFLKALQYQPVRSERQESNWHQQIRPAWRQQQRQSRSSTRHQVKQRLQKRSGRWIPVTAFAVMGKDLSPEERVKAQTRLLLQRYGILVKEFYRKENGLVPWSQIFQVLKRMEWRGEVHRGYFVQGLSGIQFALPEALERLEQIQVQENKDDSLHVLSTMDPALPFGGWYEWDLYNVEKKPVAVTRSAANHLLFIGKNPVMYSEQYGERLVRLLDFQKEHSAIVAGAFHRFLRLSSDYRPRKQIRIRTIDGIDAARHELQPAYGQAGYESDGASLLLWPSRV